MAEKGQNLTEYIAQLVRAALAEDVGTGDITTAAIVPERKRGVARVVAGERMVVAGLDVMELVFKTVDSSIEFKKEVKEGATVRKGRTIATIKGRLKSILTAERVALNFLQRLSGIATFTRKFVDKLRGKEVNILDTRKTTPCMRVLEKYAVRVGGGLNHRFGLFDAVLIKDNHIAVAGGIEKAVKKVRRKYGKDKPIEVEAKSLKEVKEALRCGVDIIMLDNMSPDKVKKALSIISGKAVAEVSGGVNLDNIEEFAGTGIRYISIGALTHSARAVDISIEVE